jgi:hypothetical protein
LIAEVLLSRAFNDRGDFPTFQMTATDATLARPPVLEAALLDKQAAALENGQVNPKTR